MLLGKVAHLRQLSNSVVIACPLSHFSWLLLCHLASTVPKAGEATFERYFGKTCRVCYSNEASLNWNGEDRPVLI